MGGRMLSVQVAGSPRNTQLAVKQLHEVDPAAQIGGNRHIGRGGDDALGQMIKDFPESGLGGFLFVL